MTLRSLTPHELSQFTGTIFRNRYKILRAIGCGANGAVYEAEDLQFDGQRRAVKLALSVFSENEFNREARTVGQLNDDHVVKVWEYGVQDGIPFIVMDFLQGESLFDILERYQRKLPNELITKFVREIGQALRSAHDRNVIHRDLKPQNILLVDSGNTDDEGRTIQKFVLVDFGIASKIDSNSTLLNRTMMGLGTPEYRSPEQINAEDISPSTDIYTFGVVLYELLAGRVPFPAASGSHTALARLYLSIASESPPRPSDVAPDRNIDPDVEDLVMQCLEKDPLKRPASIREVRQRYLKIVEPAATTPVPDTRIPNRTLWAGSETPSLKRTIPFTSSSTTKPEWMTGGAQKSIFGRMLSLVLGLLCVAGGGAWIVWISLPSPAPPVLKLETWHPEGFEARGDSIVFAGRRYARELVRKIPGLPDEAEVVFVLIQMPRAHGAPDYVYLLRDKAWYGLYQQFVAAASNDLRFLGNAWATLAELKEPLDKGRNPFSPDADPADGNRPKWPVTYITPNAAFCFARWLVPAEKSFDGGRLPSIDEWWAAAGWFPGAPNTSGPSRGEIEVASKRKTPASIGTQKDDLGLPNADFQIHVSRCNDMAGNGYEWTGSKSVEQLDETSNTQVAKSVEFPVKPTEKLVYVGESFRHAPATFEDYKGEGVWRSREAKEPADDIGFRVAFSLPSGVE